MTLFGPPPLRTPVGCRTLVVLMLLVFVAVIVVVIVPLLPATMTSSSCSQSSSSFSSSHSPLHDARRDGRTWKVVVLQADDRSNGVEPLFDDNRRMNQQACRVHDDKLEYIFLSRLDAKEFTFEAKHGLMPHFAKIDIVQRFLGLLRGDGGVCLAMLDGGDAWIVNAPALHAICGILIESGRWGAFSRDPYGSAAHAHRENTFVNSGAFILRVCPEVRRWFDEAVAASVMQNSAFHETWPYDQFYVSRAVEAHARSFIVYPTEVLNTRNGTVIAHQWFKEATSMRSAWRQIRSKNWTAGSIDDQRYLENSTLFVEWNGARVNVVDKSSQL